MAGRLSPGRFKTYADQETPALTYGSPADLPHAQNAMDLGVADPRMYRIALSRHHFAEFGNRNHLLDLRDFMASRPRFLRQSSRS